jgi:transposase
MGQVSIVGIDLAKRVFQLHGAAADGTVMFRRKLSRSQLPGFLARLPACTVAMEACASAHFWGREAAGLGHRVRLIAPASVKPFVKRQKNDMADAEAIAEAASRPTMRFVAVKSEAAQERAVLFRTRDLLVRQRTQAINALRGHLAEFGVVAPQGSWLARMLGKKPPLLVAIALANRMARSVWAMLMRNEDYREPAAAAA